LLDEAFEGRAFQLQAELLNRLGEDLLDFYRRFFEIGHRWRSVAQLPLYVSPCSHSEGDSCSHRQNLEKQDQGVQTSKGR
jgi:hypothetical protein